MFSLGSTALGLGFRVSGFTVLSSSSYQDVRFRVGSGVKTPASSSRTALFHHAF